MKLKKFTADKKETGEVSLPVQFKEVVRSDLVKRAVLAVQANKRQAYGHDKEAGMKHTPDLSRRRRKYRGSYNHGISRVPRKIHSRNGTRMNWVGAEVASTVGGREAHPPRTEKVWSQKINLKEKRKAIRSAIAATIDKSLLKARGHRLPEGFPFVLDSKVENLDSTKVVSDAFSKLGFDSELDRAGTVKIRAGKGKMRGRRTKTRCGPLVVVSKVCPLKKAARNLPGVQVVMVDKLNAELLAPGAVPGRLTLWTEAALERLGKEELFC